ncbi:hypothetical protein V6N11_020303 [Hibiscus sabdariffa]|uniref:Uncharacterized protein n=1 Tax=Hibiscus sabdariffa TaxID=183260 RepID=A0ABR2Q814_9ROSI
MTKEWWRKFDERLQGSHWFIFMEKKGRTRGSGKIFNQTCFGKSQSRSVWRTDSAWLQQIEQEGEFESEKRFQSCIIPLTLFSHKISDGDIQGSKMRFPSVCIKGTKRRDPNIIKESNRSTITDGPSDVLEEFTPAIRKCSPKRGAARSCN